MPFASRGGVQIYYEDSGGAGEVLFLTHGFGSGSGLWDGQLGLGAQFRLIRWDMRGHARSDSPDDPAAYSKQHQVDDMEAVLDACSVQEAVFLGHSMGAYDSLLFYFSSPERAKRVRALILFGSGPGFAKAAAREAWNRGAERLAETYAARGNAALVGSDREKGHTERGAKVGLAHAARNVFAQRDGDPLFARFPEGAAVAVRRLSELRVPVLVIVGELDKAFRASSEVMRAKAPDARLVLIPGAGHMANERQPALFNEAVAQFARSLSRAAPSKL